MLKVLEETVQPADGSVGSTLLVAVIKIPHALVHGVVSSPDLTINMKTLFLTQCVDVLLPHTVGKIRFVGPK